MSKHTPGEWIADGKDVRSTVRTPGSRLVAEAHFREDPEETEANARLIAAAPDLLAACRSILAMHRGGPNAVGNWDAAYAADATRDKASAEMAGIVRGIIPALEIIKAVSR